MGNEAMFLLAQKNNTLKRIKYLRQLCHAHIAMFQYLKSTYG